MHLEGIATEGMRAMPHHPMQTSLRQTKIDVKHRPTKSVSDGDRALF